MPGDDLAAPMGSDSILATEPVAEVFVLIVVHSLTTSNAVHFKQSKHSQRYSLPLFGT